MRAEEWFAACPVQLNPQQLAAVRAVDGPVLLLAVPGSGKTTVLITRLAYMISVCGIPAGQILTVTYTVAAARDMRARYASLFGENAARNLEFRTINGLSARIIRRCEEMLGRPAFQLETNEGKLSALVGDLYRQATGEYAVESVIKALRTAITYIKNMQMTDEEIEENWKDSDIPIGRIYAAYCAALRERRMMDYDDQMVYAYRILRQFPQVLEDFRHRYRYFCVDEAQDTSRIQHSILNLLAAQSGNLFMVGDEDQSIYGFRAAFPQALMEFEQDHPGGQVLLMERNYRSTRQITAAAARVISRNQNRRPKDMSAESKNGPEPETIWVNDRGGQYPYLLALADDCRTETAVLYRNHESILPVLDLLDRKRLPCRRRESDAGFFSHRCVRDIQDIIRFAADMSSEKLFLRIYYKFNLPISRRLAEKAVHEGGGVKPLFDVLSELEELPAWVRPACRALHTHFTRLMDDRGDRAIYRIRHYMGYGDYLEEHGGDTGKLDILQSLGLQESSPAGLLRRLDELEILVREGSGEEECQLVFSTIHASKGLEYERVILMDVADGVLPGTVPTGLESPEEREALEEERRLFYVGITRARQRLQVFRFKSQAITSSFSEELFRKEAPAQKKKAGPKRESRSRQKERAAVQDMVPALFPGAEVAHRSFGRGVVTALQGDIATIEFQNGAVKKISVSVAAGKGHLSLSE